MICVLTDSPIDTTKLYNQLAIWEGRKSYVYDDHNGEPIVKGYTVQGNPTIGIGRLATAARGLSPYEQQYLCGNDIAICLAEAEKQPWWGIVSQQPEPRIRGYVSLGFDPGFGSLAQFSRFTSATMQGDWAGAAAQLDDSLFARQVGHREVEIANMILSGEDPA